MLGNFSPEKNTHHLNVFHRKFNFFIENLTELPNFMVYISWHPQQDPVILELCCTSSRFGMRKEFLDQISKYVFLFFEPFVAKMAVLMLKKLRIHCIRSEIFFLKIGQYWYQKIRIFTLISKM
jgi:hypothetical protein